MKISDIAEQLNQLAIQSKHAIAELPELRKKYLRKQQLPNKIFTFHTIFSGEYDYAFHHGGRDEMQFNIGNEIIEGTEVSRFGLCFSLEASRSLPNPVQDLTPFKNRFNEYIRNHSGFGDFKMWYYHDGVRNGNFDIQEIPQSWFSIDNFICIGKIIHKPLNELNEKDFEGILQGFDQLLPIYKFAVFGVGEPGEGNKIFTRLTSNDNNWELPSPHKWNSKHQGKQNIPFENQYGFGHEEWLLNPRYNINGFQYGFIRGISHSKDDLEGYDQVHLYTVRKNKNANEVYYLGFINNVMIIKNSQGENLLIKHRVAEFGGDMITEVQNINGDVKGILKFPFNPVVKFKLDDLHLLQEPTYQPNFDLARYKRFQPYQFTDNIEEIFEFRDGEFSTQFQSGKSSQTHIYNRQNRESSVTIEKLHSQIVDALENFLKPNFSLTKGNLSIETMRFYGNIADVVTLEIDDSISIYEVKTSWSARRNIRDAIAQLLDYALHSGNLAISKLVIVSPVKLNDNDVRFLDELRSNISFEIRYLYHKMGTSDFIWQ